MREKRTKSLNSFGNNAPKIEWMRDFFERKADFLAENSLGLNQKQQFKRFLRDAGLITKKNEITDFAGLSAVIGWDTDIFFGLILVNLAAVNPQIEWYIRELDIGVEYSRSDLKDRLTEKGYSKGSTSSILRSYKRMAATPLGTVLRFGFVMEGGALKRMKCSVSDSRVVLYGLYKFAEKCSNYREFILSVLMDDRIVRDGLSPTRIFGLGREEMPPILLGLSAKYTEYITASFTHDLEKITLAEDKTASDVLTLFAVE